MSTPHSVPTRESISEIQAQIANESLQLELERQRLTVMETFPLPRASYDRRQQQKREQEASRREQSRQKIANIERNIRALRHSLRSYENRLKESEEAAQHLHFG